MKKILLFFFSHRTLALLRWDLYFSRVRLANYILLRRRLLDKKIIENKGIKYLNLGSGPRGLVDDKWVNIDGFKDKNVHYLCDFNKHLPFEDATFDGIFCEHVVEHFDYIHGKSLLSECFRILKKGGALRIIVPDGEKILKSYFENPVFIVQYKDSRSGLPMEAVNTWFYQRYEHQCIYDAAYLSFLLNEIGFSGCRKTAYNETNYQGIDIVIDDEKYSWESLYVEALK